MTDDLSRLVREVERLVTAPYAPSLLDLYDLVHQISPVVVESWASHKPCQAVSLADVLVEGLSRSRVALPLVSAFASTSTFRDALLKRYPVALDTFLEKAIGQGETEYYSACVALLSSPLPSDIVPPARLGAFVTKLMSRMAENPCVETIAPLQTLMKGLSACPRILEHVPPEAMWNLQMEFTKTLRNLDDHMGNLLCLAIFAQIASALGKASQTQHGPELPPWLLKIKHFFGPKRGLKTLDLVVLRVILASSPNCNSLPPASAAESIDLAISIADAVEPEQKQAWISANSSKITKLCEKITRDGIDDEIQIMGTTFLLCLVPAPMLPPQISELGLRALLTKDSAKVLSFMPAELVSRLLKALVNSGESAPRDLVNFAFSALQRKNPSNWIDLSSCHLALLILNGLQSSPVLSTIADSVCTLGKEHIGGLLQRFPMKPTHTHCGDLEICCYAFSVAYNQLCLTVFNLYAAAALTQKEGDDADIRMMKCFVDRVTKSLPRNQCARSASNAQDVRISLTMRDAHSCSPAHHSNLDWRLGITEAFMQNAQVSHDNVLRKIEDVCFDLENRCYNVEAPLRAVEAERGRLLQETEQVKRQKEDLERRLQQSTSTISNLQHELTQLEEHAGSACAQVEGLSASLDSARQEMQEQQRSSEERMRIEKEKARSRELDLIATSTEKDDQVEELQKEMHYLQEEHERIRQTLDIVSKEKAVSLEANAALCQELATVENHLQSHKLQSAQKEDEMNRLLTANEDLRMEMGTIKTTMENQSSEIRTLCFALQEAEEKMRSEVELLKHNREIEVSQATSALADQKEENQRLRALMQAAASNASTEIQARDKQVEYLEKTVQCLRNERTANAREFSEAQQHISRLMRVMGFAAQPTELDTSSKHPRIQPALNSVQPVSMQQATGPEDDTQLAESFESLASNLNRPSSKQSKSNHRSMHPLQLSASQSSTRNSSLSKTSRPPVRAEQSARKPLEETDRNSPTKLQLKSTFKHAQYDPPYLETWADDLREENCHQKRNFDVDLELSRDFDFTSTAFSGSNDQSGLQ